MDDNILSPVQLGFVTKNRRSDAHTIMHSLVKQKCHTEKSKLYSCFVDFNEAFDSVPRDFLLEKLLNIETSGKFFSILWHIYTPDKA